MTFDNYQNNKKLTVVELINKILIYRPKVKKSKLWNKKKATLVRILKKLENEEKELIKGKSCI